MQATSLNPKRGRNRTSTQKSIDYRFNVWNLWAFSTDLCAEADQI